MDVSEFMIEHGPTCEHCLCVMTEACTHGTADLPPVNRQGYRCYHSTPHERVAECFNKATCAQHRKVAGAGNSQDHVFCLMIRTIIKDNEKQQGVNK
jgi:hypothetical protein